MVGDSRFVPIILFYYASSQRDHRFVELRSISLLPDQLISFNAQRLAKKGPDHNAYYHPLFLRGKHELTGAMTRLVNPGRRLTK